MSILDKILGRPLATWEAKSQELTIATGVPSVGLDALSSIAYGPEAALMLLLPLGAYGLHFFPFIMIGVVILLMALYLSYQQTIAAYPQGGGAYIVASDNLGKRAGLWAAVSLLIDYLLNVAVGISAGVGAIVSAIPALQPYTLSICLFVLLTLTLLNLRGVRESGLVFIMPTIIFVLCIAATLAIGMYQIWKNGGSLHPVIQPAALPAATATVSIWLLLGAFANGLTAMTGVEAVSNVVPLFRQPSVINAQRTLTIIVMILALLLLGVGYVCPAYQIGAMDETQPGYQTILSQLTAAIFGRGVFYYISLSSIFIILTYSAQTSFVGFPRVCRLLAEDGYLPLAFAERGRRLVYSIGIVVLAFMSALLLIAFKGITFALIPLFAVGAFSAFLFSQIGMVIYWLKKGAAKNHYKLFVNALGAFCTAIALVIIVVEKFIDGAWIVVAGALGLVLLLNKIKRHYKNVTQQSKQKLNSQSMIREPFIVIIPISGWNCVAEKALQFGRYISDDITAVFISTENNANQDVKKLWKQYVEDPANAANYPAPQLKIIHSAFRQVYKPILDFISVVKKENPKRTIAVIIPELIEPHWYEYMLHNLHAAGLRTLIYLQRDQRIIVINVPWFLR